MVGPTASALNWPLNPKWIHVFLSRIIDMDLDHWIPSRDHDRLCCSSCAREGRIRFVADYNSVTRACQTASGTRSKPPHCAVGKVPRARTFVTFVLETTLQHCASGDWNPGIHVSDVPLRIAPPHLKVCVCVCVCSMCVLASLCTRVCAEVVV